MAAPSNRGMGDNGPPADKAGPYAIYRTAKITNMGSLEASSQHANRTRETLNADPSRAHLNRILIGSDDPAADMRELIPSSDARDADGLLLRRKNSVIAVEVLMTTSPEWWHTASDEDKAAWEIASVLWLQETWGAENVAHVRMHGDETTPHLTGYVIPLDERGALNCRSFIGEKQQLRDQQTTYAEAVEHLGLQRGVAGSTATHQAIRRAYGQLEADEQPIAVPAPPHLIRSPEEWAAEATRQMVRDLAPTTARAKNADISRTEAKAANAQAAKDRGRADRVQVDRDAQRAIADKMRTLDLHDVCDELGLTYSKADDMWRGDGCKINIGTGDKSGKYFDHFTQNGGGGAIDLVRHVMDTDFKSSLSWLSSRFGSDATTADLTAQLQKQAEAQVSAAVEERKPFTPPALSDENWPRVRAHLVDDRKLPARYIDRLHERGECYADDKKNAVFLCRDEEGDAVGAEVKGTVIGQGGKRFSGLAAGSKKNLGGFRIGSIAKAQVIYLVESAIDAISLLRLKTMEGERDIAVISTAGVTPEPRTWFADLAKAVKRICAFDADEAGDKDAHSLRRHGFERLRPTRGKDWNDELVSVLSDLDTTPAPASKPDTSFDSDDIAP